jgi:hypothetical protein
MNAIEGAIATRCSYLHSWTVDRDDQIASPDQNVGDILNLCCLTHRHKELLGTPPPAPMASPRDFRGTEGEQLNIVRHQIQNRWKISVICKLIDASNGFNV